MQDGGGHFCGGSMIAKVSMRYMCSVLEYCKYYFADPPVLEVCIIDYI